MKTSLVIATYNWAEALRLCLKSVEAQHTLPNEIILADDGSTKETKSVIDTFRKQVSIPVTHVWHHDAGFRKTMILNKAIAISKGDYVIEIDGDIILHRCFVKDHIRFAKPHTFVAGRRTSLSELATKKLLNGNSKSLSWLSNGVSNRELGIRSRTLCSLFPSKPETNSNSVGGGNIAFWKHEFMRVNGYNNDIQGWGAEDKEFGQRLVNAGVLKRKLRFGAIQFHLHHREVDKTNHETHRREVEELIQNGTIICQSGVKELSDTFSIFTS